MQTIDTPLTRLKAKYEAEIKELKLQAASVRGVNDMLKLELTSLEKRLLDMQKMLDEAFEHVRTLKFNLPDIQK